MKNELNVYIRARYPLLWVVTSEEERALDEIEEVATGQRKRMWVWSMTTGLANVALPNQVDKAKRDPQTLLSAILDDTEEGIWVLKDFHPFLRYAHCMFMVTSRLSMAMAILVKNNSSI